MKSNLGDEAEEADRPAQGKRTFNERERGGGLGEGKGWVSLGRGGAAAAAAAAAVLLLLPGEPKNVPYPYTGMTKFFGSFAFAV